MTMATLELHLVQFTFIYFTFLGCMNHAAAAVKPTGNGTLTIVSAVHGTPGLK